MKMNADHVLNAIIRTHESRGIVRLACTIYLAIVFRRLCAAVAKAAITDEKLLDAAALCFISKRSRIPAQIADRVLDHPNRHTSHEILKARAIRARTGAKIGADEFRLLLADARRGDAVLRLLALAALHRHSGDASSRQVADQAWEIAKNERHLRGWYYALLGTPRERLELRMRVPNFAPLI